MVTILIHTINSALVNLDTHIPCPCPSWFHTSWSNLEPSIHHFLQLKQLLMPPQSAVNVLGAALQDVALSSESVTEYKHQE